MKTHKPIPRHKLVSLMVLVALTACLCGASRSDEQDNRRIPEWTGTVTMVQSRVEAYQEYTWSGTDQQYVFSGEYRSPFNLSVTTTFNSDGTIVVEGHMHEDINGSFVLDGSHFTRESSGDATATYTTRRGSEVSLREDGSYSIASPGISIGTSNVSILRYPDGRQERTEIQGTLDVNGPMIGVSDAIDDNNEEFLHYVFLMKGKVDPCATVLSGSKTYTMPHVGREDLGPLDYRIWNGGETWTVTWNLRRNLKPPSVPTLLSPDDHATVSPAPTFWMSLTPQYATAPHCDPTKFVIEVMRTEDNTIRAFETDFVDRTPGTGKVQVSYTVPSNQLLPLGIYLWRAKAVDSQGMESAWSEPRIFHLECPSRIEAWMFGLPEENQRTSEYDVRRVFRKDGTVVTVSDDYVFNRKTDKSIQEKHKGLDFQSRLNGIPTPLPFKTPMGGVVSYDPNSHWNTITLTLDNGNYIQFLHASEVFVTSGRVEPGTVLGVTGGTGVGQKTVQTTKGKQGKKTKTIQVKDPNAHPVHLHVQAKDRSGNYIDPDMAFAEACQRGYVDLSR